MFEDRISDYVEGVAAKYLSAVDAEPAKSNQHEIGGLPKAGFKAWLGTPAKHEVFRYRCRQIYISDENEEPLICDSSVTWYDCRRNVEHRGPEYRLYYYDSPVTSLIQEGDFFLVAKLCPDVLPLKEVATPEDGHETKNGSLLMIFAPADSSAEHQLRHLFGIDKPGDSFKPGKLDAGSLLLPLRLMLESLGIELQKSGNADNSWLEKLLVTFGGTQFPATAAFSEFARNTIASDVDALTNPDNALMAWMDHEEKLFRLYERHLVQQRLRNGFGVNGDDVDEFISYSLSVQNRRKSRVGHAFEGHLDHMFKLHQLSFQQGRGKGNVTENNAKPDFIFPSFKAYHDPDFPQEKLLMLGAKTTCKDRWRQVLSEAARIPKKHLITLEAAISVAQTEEMAMHDLQLIVPESVQSTYTMNQQEKLLNVSEFISRVKAG